jgi:hypothetical protein
MMMARFAGAWLVITGEAVPVVLFDEDTTVVTIETDGSRASYVACRNYVSDEKAYNILLSKLIVWLCSKNRFYWTGDLLGSQVMEAAEDHYNEHMEHKNEE